MAKNTLFQIQDGQLVLCGAECKQCQHRWFPPLQFGCEQCGAHGNDIVATAFSGRATIYSFTSVPDPDGDPFVLAQLILDDGPAIRGILDPSAAAKPGIGDRVEAVAHGVGEQVTVSFRKVTS